jgi:flagellar assembly factor FliW
MTILMLLPNLKLLNFTENLYYFENVAKYFLDDIGFIFTAISSVQDYKSCRGSFFVTLPYLIKQIFC